jgi:hypothetical protein
MGTPTRSRRRFQDWWSSHSAANDVPDFLRLATDPKPVPKVKKVPLTRLASSGPSVTGS